MHTRGCERTPIGSKGLEFGSVASLTCCLLGLVFLMGLAAGFSLAALRCAASLRLLRARCSSAYFLRLLCAAFWGRGNEGESKEVR